MSTVDAAAVARATQKTTLLGKRAIVLAETGSTNDQARALANEGAAEGTIVVAQRQTGGRGRLGRAWASPEGGLYLSIVLRPSEDMLRRAPLSLLTALAASEAIDVAARVATSIKWPNNVLLSGKKVGGILADLSREKGESLVVLGIGINVDTDTKALPAEVRATATSLSEAKGAPVSIEDVLRHLLEHLEGHYLSVRRGGGALVLSRAADRMATLGQRVRVKLADRVVEGKASGLNATGALVVDTDAGAREVIYAGDVEEVRSF